MEVVHISRALGADRLQTTTQLASAGALHVLSGVGRFLGFWRDEVAGEARSCAEGVGFVLLDVAFSFGVARGTVLGVG